MRYKIKYKKNKHFGGSVSSSDSDSDYDRDNETNYNYREQFRNGKPDLSEYEIGIVLNSSEGGFDLSDYAREKLGVEQYQKIDRFN